MANGVPTWTLSERPESVSVPTGSATPAARRAVGQRGDVEAGRGGPGQVGRDDDLLVAGAGDGRLADAADALDPRYARRSAACRRTPAGRRRRWRRAPAPGSRRCCRRAPCGVTPVGQLGGDAAQRGLDLGHRGVEVGAEHELQLDGRAALARGGHGLLQPVDAGQAGLDRFGDLTLDDRRRRARVVGHDERGREVQRREQLLLQRRDRQQPEPGHDDRDERHQPAVGQTQPGKSRHDSPTPL